MIRHEGTSYVIDGKPVTAVEAHRVMAAKGVPYRKRVRILGRLKCGAELPQTKEGLYVHAVELAALLGEIRAAAAVGDLNEIRQLITEYDRNPLKHAEPKEE